MEDVATHRQGLSPGMPPGMYRPMTPGALEAGDEWAVQMVVHLRGEPEASAPRLRRLATNREIGFRVAFGAGPRGIVSAIFARAGRQLGAGVGVGVLLWVLQVVALRRAAETGPAPEQGGGGFWFLLAVVGIMAVVGLLACGLPTRRAHRIEPTDALRYE